MIPVFDLPSTSKQQSRLSAGKVGISENLTIFLKDIFFRNHRWGLSAQRRKENKNQHLNTEVSSYINVTVVKFLNSAAIFWLHA